MEAEAESESRWKHVNFCGSESTLKREAEIGSKLGSIWLFEEPKAFFITHWQERGSGSWKRKLEAVEEVKFLWKRKHFEERSGIKLGSD